jgi:hypothetical protein
MQSDPIPSTTHGKLSFDEFYEQVFLPEHQAPYNRLAHLFGTFLGLMWVALCLANAWFWLLLLFPVVHAVPGLIGHRIFERNPAIGDIRVNRKDHSPLWFIAANHRLALDFILGRLGKRGA